MRHLMLLLLSLCVFPILVVAKDGCTETRTTPTKILDKAVSFYDKVVPILLHDPKESIQFHLSRAKTLYDLSEKTINSNPERAVNIAMRGQNHLTLLEADIRNVQKGDTVPYDEIFTHMQEISPQRDDLIKTSTSRCTDSFQNLVSFQQRTDEALKKLYYESLLPQ